MRVPRSMSWTASLLVWVGCCATATFAADVHVTPDGKPDGDGTEAKPLDLATALRATDRVKPGDTVWLHAGTYRHAKREGDGASYDVTLRGSAEQPVVVRARPGERVTIDGTLRVIDPSTFVWIRDLELTVTEPRREVPRSR